MIINGVEFWMDTSATNRSPIFRRGRNGTEGMWSLQLRSEAPITAGDLLDADKALLGFNQFATAGGKKYVHRQNPAPFPFVIDAESNPDARAYLYVHSIVSCEPISPKAEGWSEDDALPEYTYGFRYKVMGSTRPYRIREDSEIVSGGAPDEGIALTSGEFNSRNVRVRPMDATRVITLPPGLMKWDDLDADGKTQAMRTSYPLSDFRSRIEVTWFGVPRANIPFATIESLANKCNDGKFLGLQIGSVAFTGWALDPYTHALGQAEADVIYYFTHQPSGFDSMPRVLSGVISYAKFSADGSGLAAAKLVKKADLTLLFRPV